MDINSENNDKVYGTVAAKSPKDSVEVHPMVARLLRAKRFVVGGWLLMFGASLPFTQLLLAQVSMVLEPVKGTDTARAMNMIDRDFPLMSQTVGASAMISCTAPCTTVLDEFSTHAFRELARVHERLNSTHPGILKSWDPADYVAGTGLRLSANKQSVLYNSKWLLPQRGGTTMVEMAAELRETVNKLAKEGRSFGRTVGVAGVPPALEAFMKTTEKELAVKDALVLPVALAMFVYQVGSWRLAILTMACMFATIVIAFATMVPVTYFGPNLAPVAPSFMMVTAIAMSVDYGMFLMSRFREELQQGRSLELSLSIALVQCGSVVGLSGGILIMCWACCMLYPGYLVFTLALGTIWTLVICLATSLTISPCMISMFPGFFTRDLRASPSNAQQQRSGARGSRLFFRLGEFVTRWPMPILVPLVIYACMLPAAWQLSKFQPSEHMLTDIPRGRQMDDFVDLLHAFPAATRDPIYMYLPAAGHGGTVKSDAFFAEGCKVVRSILDSSRGNGYPISPTDFTSVVAVPGPPLCPKLVCLRWSQRPPECPLLPSARELLNSPPQGLLAPVGTLYREAWAQLVSSGNMSALLVLSPSFDQSHGLETPFVKMLREAVPRRAVFSTGIAMYDMKQEDYHLAPWVLALVVALMMTFITVAFGAALTPFKLFFTVIIPLFAVYGLMIAIFQEGILDWLHSTQLHGKYGVSWSMPVVTVPVLVGLAVDYDVFLFARVFELREQGFDNRAAVVGAISLSGPIITGAGTIMGLAFAGLILSDIHSSVEMGFLLAFGVLLDTFVIRNLLVPCILMLGGGLNFWPQQMPEPTRTVEDAEEYLCNFDVPKTPLRRGWGNASALLQRAAP